MFKQKGMGKKKSSKKTQSFGTKTKRGEKQPMDISLSSLASLPDDMDDLFNAFSKMTVGSKKKVVKAASIAGPVFPSSPCSFNPF